MKNPDMIEMETRDRKKILCIGAHPDDVELGMAGTAAKHASRGDDVLMVICTLGIGGASGGSEERELEAKTSAKILNCGLRIIDYPVLKLNRPSDEFSGIMRRLMEEFNPDRLYTHSPCDYHQVHESVAEGVMHASPNVPQILQYEVASSTTPEFRPNAYVNITDFINVKIQCLQSHSTQAAKNYMQENITRSLAHSRYVLGKIGSKPDGMAESFAVAKFAITDTRPRTARVQEQSIQSAVLSGYRDLRRLEDVRSGTYSSA
jgi:LmbE family N-acetylglucosaminyl deacetylase